MQQRNDNAQTDTLETTTTKNITRKLSVGGADIKHV